MLDRLLKRLFRRKEELLRVLSRPEIPLNANASENDIRAFVTKRKISGGTVSDNGRDARDVGRRRLAGPPPDGSKDRRRGGFVLSFTVASG
jgi:hypothetical protein